MTEQRFAATGIERVVVELERRDLEISWVESDEIVLEGDDLVADTASGQLRVSSDLFSAEIGHGARISLGLLFVGAERAGGRASMLLPRSLPELYLRMRQGNVDLNDARGKCEVHVDRGDLRLRGGEGSARLTLGSGDLEVEGYTGPLSITGGSGDKVIRRVRGALAVTNGSGDLELIEVEGDLALTTGSGDIDLRDCRNERLAIQTGSGEVKLLRGFAGALSTMTGSGDVDCDVDLGPHHHSIESGSGDISLGVPVGISARIEATTTRGKIDSDVPLVEVGQRGKRSLFGKRLVGSVGEGAERAEIRLRTASGDITLRWRRDRDAEPYHGNGAGGQAWPGGRVERTQRAGESEHGRPPAADLGSPGSRNDHHRRGFAPARRARARGRGRTPGGEWRVT
jgi:hypothetical protein